MNVCLRCKSLFSGLVLLIVTLLLWTSPVSAADLEAVAQAEGRVVCTNSSPSRLAVGGRAVVSIEPAFANSVRTEPSPTAAIIGRIEPGKWLTILDGPECAGGWVWWYVRSDEDVTGWTSEGDASSYWLLPAYVPVPEEPRVTNLYSCLSPCHTDGSNSIGVFADATAPIYLRWQYENIAAGVEYVRVWSMGGREWVRYKCTWPGPEDGIHAISLLEASGLRSGVWTMRIEVNGATVAQTELTVAGDYRVWEPVRVRTNCADGVSSSSTGGPSEPTTRVPMEAYGIINANANLRSGPGTSYSKIGGAADGTVVEIVDANTTGTWYQLASSAWVAAYLVDLCEGAYPDFCMPAAIFPR